MPAPNVYGKPFCALSHQSRNLLTTPHNKFGGEESSSLVKSGCRLSGVVTQKETRNKQVEEMPATVTDLSSGEKKKNCVVVLRKI
jgi:hypothetical protein